MKERILEILQQELPQINFESSADLVDDGILDSLSIVTMVSALSMEYGIAFDMENLSPENFNSIDDIVETVQSYLDK